MAHHTSRMAKLNEQLKYPRVEDKPSGCVTSNQTELLSHPIQLNAGKYQTKVEQLLYSGPTWLAFR